MTLPHPAPRRHLHTRRIAIEGYLRDDGYLDVDAHLTDTRTYPYSRFDGAMKQPGDPLHDMSMRMTISLAREIIACHASMDETPFAVCPAAAPNFARLVGLRVEAGFLKRALELVGGVEGCTHLRELLQQVATVFLQTLHSVGKVTDQPRDVPGNRPALLNSCFAWSDKSDMVARRFPVWHKPEDNA